MSTTRRQLQFRNLDEALAEAERLVMAEHEGKLARRGSWTLGQTLGHLAAWNAFAYDGYPAEIRAPWALKMVIKVLRGRLLRDGMRAGIKLRGVPGGTVGTDVVSTEEGFARFQASIERVRGTTPVHASPLLREMTREEAEMLALRHAELHLGFQEVRER